MTSHEILGFMSSKLSTQILDELFVEDKPFYKAVLAGVANARKVRPLFLEKLSRAERHPMMINALSRPSMDESAGNLLRGWLLKKQKPLLRDFLDGLGIAHEDGVVENLPDSVEDAKLHATTETLLGKYPHEAVAVYLLAFNQMNETRWSNLDALLQKDPRLQLGG
ncbi:MAG TPA: hypothetical protein VI454_10140 [Verrucomicrobiae bacterium]|jgi:hypothetical protein